MKKFFFSLCSLALLFTAQYNYAQTDFAPVGAEWYHGMAYGVFHSRVTHDTIIDGISCRMIQVSPEVKNQAQSPTIHASYKYFVYNNADTVFIYNTIFQRFTPLYVFNVNEGDTLYLPAIQPEAACFQAQSGLGYTDSNLCLIIDSVRMVSYDNQILKTIYTHNWDRNDNYNYPDYALDTYVERIGGLGSGFLPYCNNCARLLDESAQSMGGFRCYTDNQTPPFSVKLFETCGNGPTAGISGNGFLGNVVSVYPNPSLGKVQVSFSSAFPAQGQWGITDVVGRELVNGPIEKGSTGFEIDLSAYRSGIYLLQLNDMVGQSKVVKIVLGQ